jgi:hypothetical protein
MDAHDATDEQVDAFLDALLDRWEADDCALGADAPWRSFDRLQRSRNGKDGLQP